MFERRRQTVNEGNPWYREPIMWLVVLIPGSSVLMGAVLIGLAVSTDDGLVVDDYYQRGLEINRSLERDRTAARLELEARVWFEPDAGSTRLLLGGSETLVAPAALRLELVHATRAGRDQMVTLRGQGRGEYAGDYVRLEAGRWLVQLEAPEWRLTGSLAVPGGGQPLRLAYDPGFADDGE